MATPTPQPPAGLLDAIRQAARDVLPGRLNTMREGALADESGASSVDPEFEAPRPLYNLGLDRIVDGSGLDAADLVGWRTIVTIATHPVAVVDAAPDAPTVRSFNYGPFVGGLAHATDATRAAQDAAGDVPGAGGGAGVEERVLQVPALYFVGLWIHDADDSGNDVIVPVAPAPPGLRADERYPAAEVISQLSPLANARLETDDHGDRNVVADNA